MSEDEHIMMCELCGTRITEDEPEICTNTVNHGLWAYYHPDCKELCDLAYGGCKVCNPKPVEQDETTLPMTYDAEVAAWQSNVKTGAVKFGISYLAFTFLAGMSMFSFFIFTFGWFFGPALFRKFMKSQQKQLR